MNRPKRADVLVVIPAYNEERTIGEVIRRTLPYADVCVINDASCDGTEAITRSFPEATCLTHGRNTHIPRSILDGMKFGLDEGYAHIISMDAGLSHKPEDLPQFLGFPDRDLVIGVRTKTFNIPLFRRFISWTATGLMNLALRPPWRRRTIPRLNDATSGFRRYSRRAAEWLLHKEMKAQAFDFHIEALALICRNGFSLGEVPISYEFSNSSFNVKVLRSSIRMYFDLLLAGRK